MRCPHCNRIHSDQARFCPVTGQVIPKNDDQNAAIAQAPHRWVGPAMASLGFILIVIGGFLLTGNSSIPALKSNETDVNHSDTPQPGRSSPSQQPTPLISPTATFQPATPTQVPANADLNEWIVYAYGRENDSEIFMLRPSSGEIRQLTSNEYNDDGPSFLSRTNEVVFSSYREEGWQLYLLNLDTMKESQLTDFDGQARFPEWSPEPGVRKILFEGRGDTSSGKQYSVWLLDLDNNDLTNLTRGSADSRPQWAPDGEKIVFGRALNDSDQNGKITTADFLSIFTFNLTNGELTRVTNDPTIDNYQFTWSPDGEWILYGSARADTDGNGVINLDDSQNLWLIHPDGSGEQELHLNDDNIFSPGWSPSGNSIVYTIHQGDFREEMWLYYVTTGETTLLQTAGPIYHTEFAVKSH